MHLHTGHTVHFHPSLSPRLSSQIFQKVKGLGTQDYSMGAELLCFYLAVWAYSQWPLYLVGMLNFVCVILFPVDGTFCQAALQGKIQIKEQLPKYFGGSVQLGKDHLHI